MKDVIANLKFWNIKSSVLIKVVGIQIIVFSLVFLCSYSCSNSSVIPTQINSLKSNDSLIIPISESYSNYGFNRIVGYKGKKAFAFYDGNSSVAFYSFKSQKIDFYDVTSITQYKPFGWQITDSFIVMIHFSGHRMKYNYYTDSTILEDFHPWTKLRGSDYCVQSFNTEKIIETPKYRVMNFGPAHQKKRHFSYHFNRLWSTDLILNKETDSIFYGPKSPSYMLNRSYSEPNYQRIDLNDSVLVYSHCVNDSVLFYNLNSQKSYSALMKSPYFTMPDSIPVRPWADYLEFDDARYGVETSRYFSIHTIKELDLIVRVVLLSQPYDLENGKIRRSHQQDWAMDVFNQDGTHLASRKFNGRFYSYNSVQILNNSIIVNNEKSNTDSSFTYHVFDVSGLE